MSARPIQDYELPIEVGTIASLLPHGYPFLLLDRVIDIREDGQYGKALKNTTFSEPYFQGHFPGRPIMPGVLQIEAMAQLGGLLLLSDPKNVGRLAFLLSLQSVKFRRKIVPGDQMIVEAWLRTLKARTAVVDTRVTVEGSTAAEAQIRFMLVEDDRPTL